MKVRRDGESLNQCYNRLCRARIQAIMSGQPHDKLDKKIKYIESLSCIQRSNNTSRPSPSKYASHTKRFNRPLQGGKVSPK